MTAVLYSRDLLLRGDDFYGVIRTDGLRRTAPHDSYHHADRTIVPEIALHGPFHQVPEQLYFRHALPGSCRGTVDMVVADREKRSP